MLLIKLNSRLCTKYPSAVRVDRHSSGAVSTSQNEAENIQYPPILDTCFKARFRRHQEKKHETVKVVKTVEEKMIKLNFTRYWGFKTLMYEEGRIFYNELPHAQYITRTHVISEPKLPESYDNLVEQQSLEELVKEIKGFFEDGMTFEIVSRNRDQESSDEILKNPIKKEDLVCEFVGKQANRILASSLASRYPHLREAQVDYDPRVEAFWFAGGIELHRYIISGRKARGWNNVLDEPADRAFQYLGNPSLHLRHKLPLKEIIPLSECENPDFHVPTFKYDPRTQGHSAKRRHGTNIPGFWPGDLNQFGLMSYHKRGYMMGRNWNDELVALRTQAIYANWGWLLAQACHLGFSTYNDVTYPLVNQSVITNGQWWSFSVYQLNTTLLNNWYNDSNPKRNILWMTEPMKLYETIENGKLVGVNDDVLKTLIKFYANAPEERKGVAMQPYLGEDEKLIADIEHNDRRNFVENCYKMLMSNRPRHKLQPELYHWQWIYKHLFKTRPLDKRRTPWDYGVNPFLRRIDEHRLRYIPKKFRPVDKPKVKYAPNYYP
ncbi:39S ribosomal protein S30, mitochondrial [Diachasma alloeum]|uniref:39S ribosomal protein S30, mitochondrial n=1 Tax=Diachasma alloeum TaxID=454923 RepID=UPI000738230F|nr:39S ribosomal protein S30, mitochondrial [Diachasma alloeum]